MADARWMSAPAGSATGSVVGGGQTDARPRGGGNAAARSGRLPLPLVAALAGVLGFVLGGVLLTVGLTPAEPVDEDLVELEAFLAEWDAALATGDVDVVAELTTPDVEFHGWELRDPMPTRLISSLGGEWEPIGRPVVAQSQGYVYWVARETVRGGLEEVHIYRIQRMADGLKVAVTDTVNSATGS